MVAPDRAPRTGEEWSPMEETDPKSKSGVPRITMSWTRENYDHITVMAALKGMSMTAYVNSLVDADRERNAEVVRRARELAEEIS